MTREVIAEKPGRSATSRLVRDGEQIVCVCPWLCAAAGERCDFEDHPEFRRQHLARQRRGRIRRAVKRMARLGR